MRSDDELAVFLHHDAVDFELAAEAEVADEVGVDGGLVGAAGLGIGLAEGHVDRAAELLVEEDLAGAAVDAVVGADAELTEGSGALVSVELRDQELLAAFGAGVDDAA